MNTDPTPLTRPAGPAWLQNAIFYQLYPQSFLDTNGDGVGDIPGIISKLDYIRSLGCDVVWLNPCFASPFGDAGYDVSDFYKVAPRYGTNADLKRLFTEAHKRGMKVILDLVAGHTSTEHQWFKESAKAKPNKYSHRYIWTDNVWRAPGTGADAIRGFSERDGQYVTNFFHFQPALNYGYANPDPAQAWQLPMDHPDAQAMRRELLDIMRFWLDKGADGFRVDMAFSLVKNDPDGTATMALWREIRAVWDKDYPEAALLSEWSIPNQAIAAGFHLDFMIHFGTPAYTDLFRSERERDVFGHAPSYGDSFFDRAGKGDIKRFLDIYLAQLNATRSLGYISVPSGNHDISRISQGRTEQELKVAFAFLLTMPGVPCIYNGDEMGTRQIVGLPTKEGGYGRTGARTPMQWTSGKNAGFSDAASNLLYLPPDPAKDRPSVDQQLADPNSLLNFISALCKLRRSSAALGSMGDFQPLYAKPKKYPFVYLRSLAKEQYLIVVNPSGNNVQATIESTFQGKRFVQKFGEGVEVTSRATRVKIRAEAMSFSILAVET